ncbi:hypothetical protein AVEN_206904-1 [Araneus ventricosus]|uniref:Uncharacterized protein n=1 Tax=Araneus ventricosus TaxID=182803 RepID=A0A4Y2PH05_ARAVE|nr:hypothetical protein AVEN_206904-1 [Araneus ventricosus]
MFVFLYPPLPTLSSLPPTGPSRAPNWSFAYPQLVFRVPQLALRVSPTGPSRTPIGPSGIPGVRVPQLGNSALLHLLDGSLFFETGESWFEVRFHQRSIRYEGGVRVKAVGFGRPSVGEGWKFRIKGCHRMSRHPGMVQIDEARPIIAIV